MESPLPTVQRSAGLSNIARNLAWILGGKGFAAIVSLVYLALLSRSLGVRDFGHFSLIFGTAQALVALAGFQTWQTMIQFGAQSAREHDWARFGRLSWLCGSIDVAGAIVGCFVAALVFKGFGEALDLNPSYTDMAFWFACALIWSRMTASSGIVRVLDRFDIGSYVEAIVPTGRLIAATVIFFSDASVARFLLAWALLDLLSAMVYWIAAWWLVPEALYWRNFGHWRQAFRENPGIVKFFSITYANSTLDALVKQGPLLAVGYFLGTSAAGIFRLADQLAQGIGRFAQLVARAVFPEFVHAQIGMDAGTFRFLVRRVTLIAGGGGLIVTLSTILFGEALVDIIGGAAYVDGKVVLIVLAIGAAFELASVSYEPMFYATGHVFYTVILRALSVVALVIGIFALVGYGPVGIAWAVTIAMALYYFLMGFAALSVLREIAVRDRT